MHIFGSGFVARGLEPIADRHPHVAAFALGPSRTSASEADCAREAARLREVLAQCQRHGWAILYFSTACAAMYPLGERPSREDDPVSPQSIYTRHKLAMETVIAASGCPHLTLRMTYLAGPGQPAHNLIPALVEQILYGSVTIFTAARRDLLDIADAVTLIDSLLSLGVTDEVVNLASGHAVSVADLADHLQAVLGRTPARRLVEAGDAHQVSIDKLLGLVPRAADLGFGPHYYKSIADRYIAALSAQLSIASRKPEAALGGAASGFPGQRGGYQVTGISS
jgi:nucleoside-diphosphate-sugar epimerase